MTNAELKEKIREYPVAAISLIVIIASLGLGYYDWDEDQTLLQQKEGLDKKLNESRSNELNSRNLPFHISRAKEAYAKISASALDFDSPIVTQSFFSQFASRTSIKVESLPALQSLPTPSPGAPPFAFGNYSVHASGGFFGLKSFLHDIDDNKIKAMNVLRVQAIASDAGAKGGSDSIETDIVFKLWGRKGTPPEITGRPDVKVSTPAVRVDLLDRVEKILAHAKPEDAESGSPFGQAKTATSSVSAPSLELEQVLGQLKFSIITFVGMPAVKFEGVEGIPLKRVNSDFELKVGGVVNKLRIVSIADDHFVVQTSSGKKVKVVSKK